MMDGLVTLSPVELERMLITIESSQQVHRRHQYYLWSQGALQSFLPHDVLIIGHGEFGTPSFSYEMLARVNTWDDPDLHAEIDRLVEMMLEVWINNGYYPRLFGAENETAKSFPIDDSLQRLGFGSALVHGTRDFRGESSGFFVFLRMPEPPSRRHAYFAELLMPYLHTALHRMLSSEKDSPLGRVRPNIRLSVREAEVIALVRDGKTNLQISELLQLSPLTVKNHVQNILRKLGVANRAQAVAKAVKANLINDAVGN